MNLNPASIAIVGLSDNPAKHGARVLASLKAAGYEGEIFGVHPRQPGIDGVTMVGSTAELPSGVELVLCAIPAAAIPTAVRDLQGPSTVVVFSGGFGELGGSGADLQAELAEAARQAGVRVVGPNSGGILALDHGLAASFLTFLDRPAHQLKTGPVGLVSQSGGLLSYLHNVAAGRGQGIGAAVSTGNEVDITVAEAISAVSGLDGVRAIALIVETIRDGSAFISAVRDAHVAGVRVVACHLGRSDESRHMLETHTGALATDGRVFEGVCRSLGVAMAATPEEVFDVADVLAHSEPLIGDRLGFVTHSGGLAILLNDLAAARALNLPPPSDALTNSVEPFMQLGAIKNPLDMGAIIGGPHRFASVVEAFTTEHDLVLAVTSAHPPAHTESRVDSLLEIPGTVVHLWMAGDQGAEGLKRLRHSGAAVVTEPRAAIAAVAGAVTFLNRDQSVAVRVAAPPRRVLSEHASKVRLAEHEISTPEGGLARTAEEAVALFEKFGAPAAAKVSSPDILHKAKVGGLRLGLQTVEEVRLAFEQVQNSAAAAQPDAAIEGVLIEIQESSQEELLVSGFIDPTFGPMLAVGRGGSNVETAADVMMALAPVSPTFAQHLVDQLILRSGLGTKEKNSLASILVKVSEMAADGKEAEINPLSWTGSEWKALDAVVRI